MPYLDLLQQDACLRIKGQCIPRRQPKHTLVKLFQALQPGTATHVPAAPLTGLQCHTPTKVHQSMCMQVRPTHIQEVLRFAGASVWRVHGIDIPTVVGYGCREIVAHNLVVPKQAGAWQRVTRARAVLECRRKA